MPDLMCCCEFRLGTRAGDFDRCERPSAGETLRGYAIPIGPRQNHRQQPGEGFTHGRPVAQAAALSRHCERSTGMSTITAKDGTEIYYKDWGEGPVVTFSHGWPLSSDAWDGQMLFLAQNGFRAVAHDRRGHGRSSQASS